MALRRQRGAGLGRLMNLLGFSGVLVALALTTNPSAERHRDKIKQAAAERNVIAKWLHLGDLAAFASSYHSLGVASYTTVRGRTLSVGAFGLVFVPELGSEP